MSSSIFDNYAKALIDYPTLYHQAGKLARGERFTKSIAKNNSINHGYNISTRLRTLI
jgi:hypothetical protein